MGSLQQPSGSSLFLIYTLSGPIRVVYFSDIHPFRAHTFKVYSFTQEGRTFSVAEGFFNYGYTSFFYNYQVFFISPNQISEINLSKRSVCISYLSATPTHNLVLTLQKKFPCRKKNL